LLSYSKEYDSSIIFIGGINYEKESIICSIWWKSRRG